MPPTHVVVENLAVPKSRNGGGMSPPPAVQELWVKPWSEEKSTQQLEGGVDASMVEEELYQVGNVGCTPPCIHGPARPNVHCSM